MTAALRIATLGLTDAEHHLVAVLLRASGAELQDPWVLGTADECDALIIDPMASFRSPIVAQALGTGKPLLVGLRRAGSNSRVNVLHLNLPLRRDEFVGVLDAAARRLSGTAGRARTEREPLRATPSASAALDIAGWLAEAHRIAFGAFSIRLGEGVAVTVYFPEREFVVEGGLALDAADLVALCGTARGAAKVLELDDEQAVAPSRDGERRPLEQLCWWAGLASADRGLLPNVPGDAALRLRQWPDFGTLGDSPTWFRLAAIMSRRPLTLEQAIAAGGGRADVVTAFLNACIASGFVEASAASVAPAPAPISVRGTLSGIVDGIRRALGRFAPSA